MTHFILFALWSIGCVALGVLLSRRLIITTSDLYATLYHDARQAKEAFAALEYKIKVKAQLVEKDAKQIIKG